MVCNRCIMAVKKEIENQNLVPVSVELGEVEISEPDSQQILGLKANLTELGFEIIDDKKSKIIEKIKNEIVILIHHSEIQPNINFSEYLADKLKYDYHYLSNLFSEVEGTTIEKYLITQKIEKVKELLMYDELSLSEIADKLGYSSVAYLSNQFKKSTGLTPKFYKSLKENKRRKLDEL